MLGQIDRFRPIFEGKGLELEAPKVVQTLSEAELKELLRLSCKHSAIDMDCCTSDIGTPAGCQPDNRTGNLLNGDQGCF